VGTGPTQDDITRAALAEVMNVPLDRDEGLVGIIRTMFESRGRSMPDNNLLQADVPGAGDHHSPDPRHGSRTDLLDWSEGGYAVPGRAPRDEWTCFERAILPDLVARQRQAGETAVIRSRVLRTWGAIESALAEAVSARFDASNTKAGHDRLSRLGIEGIKVRLTARGEHDGTRRGRS